MRLTISGGFFFIGGIMLYLFLDANESLHGIGAVIALVGFTFLCLSSLGPFLKLCKKLADDYKQANSDDGTKQ